MDEKELKEDLIKAEEFAKKFPEVIQGYKNFLITFSGEKSSDF